MRLGISGLLLSVSLPLFTMAEGDSKKLDQENGSLDFEIEKRVPIEMLFGSYHNVIDLGVLPCGATGVAKIQLFNPNSATFAIEKIELGCKCTSAKITETDLDPGDETLLTIGLETPDSSRSQQKTHSVNLVTNGGEKNNVHLALRYQLSGLMAFRGGANVVEVKADVDRQKVLLPFVMTAPIRSQDIALELSPDNPGVLATMVAEGGKSFVQVEFDTVFVQDEGLSLKVKAFHEAKELSDTTSLLLCRRKQLEITPRTLRFKNIGDSMQASCLLRHRSSDLAVGEKPGSADKPRSNTVLAQASIGDLKMNVKPTKLGNGIHRLVVKIPEEKLREYLEKDDHAEVVTWQVVASDKSYSTESRYTVDSAGVLSEVAK